MPNTFIVGSLVALAMVSAAHWVAMRSIRQCTRLLELMNERYDRAAADDTMPKTFLWRGEPVSEAEFNERHRAAADEGEG